MNINTIRNSLLSFLFLLHPVLLQAQYDFPDLSRFEDSAGHWYRIFDEDKVIQPLPEKPRYKKSQVTRIADNILLFQKNNGGWPKNYDMKAVLSDEQIVALKNSKNAINTTFDNGATHSQLTYLAEAFTLTQDERYKNAFLKGMEFVLEAQYINGGWPQFYPDTSGYRKYITFNDLAMVGIMNMLQEIVYCYPQYDFIGENLRMRINQAYQIGIECIINCQIVDNGEKTAWCQQHDNIDFSPRGARAYEKASICNQESAEITKLLMAIQNPDRKVINAIENAVKWFRKSEIHGIRVDWIESTEETFLYHSSKYDRIVVNDSTAQGIWPRFSELGTHKPIFCSRDGKVYYTMAEIDRDRRTGYGWYTYEPENVLSLYPSWKEKYYNNE